MRDLGPKGTKVMGENYSLGQLFCGTITLWEAEVEEGMEHGPRSDPCGYNCGVLHPLFSREQATLY